MRVRHEYLLVHERLDPAAELVDIALLRRPEERQDFQAKALRDRQIDVAARRLVDDREIIQRVRWLYLRHARELVTDKADARQIIFRRAASHTGILIHHNRHVRKDERWVGTEGARTCGYRCTENPIKKHTDI